VGSGPISREALRPLLQGLCSTFVCRYWCIV